MTQYEIYILILCLIVFVLLTTLSIVSITLITKMYLRLVRGGLEDENLIKEYEKAEKRKCSKFSKAVDITIAVFLCAILAFAFSGSIYINCTQNVYFKDIPTYRVVQTGSMAKKSDKNLYLWKNELHDQIQTFDLIATYQIPKEEDLKLYDIVVYEVDDILVVHRIVGIEEPNERHSERYFLLQGDAVDAPDRFPVLYSQMRGIYRGEKIPFIGSFVLFMQSPAGWLCILLAVFAVIATPILEKKIANVKDGRMVIVKELQKEAAMALARKEAIEKPSEHAITPFDKLKGRKDDRTLEEKLVELPETKARYDIITLLLSSIAGVRVINSKKQITYKHKNTALARVGVRGKTLNVFLGLVPEELKDTKYKFVDLSEVEKYKNYPVRVKVTSDRQLKWTQELIYKLVEKNGLELAPLEVLIDRINKAQAFENLKGRKDDRTLDEKLSELPETKERYDEVTELLNSIVGARIIEAKKYKTFKFKSTPLARLAVRGKTLNVFLALNPKDLEGSKYKFVDQSASNKNKNYPVRVKVTSDRQLKWTKELIDRIIKENQLLVGDNGEK